MQRDKLMVHVISAWGMAIGYDWIYRTTGYDIRVLLYVAIVTMAIGLYVGLYAKDKETKKEEA